MAYTENANVNVTLNDKQAGNAIEGLENKVQGLKAELIELRKANDLVGYKKKEKELKQYQKELRNAKRQVQDVEYVLKNLNKTNLKDLTAAQRKLNAQLRNMSRSHPDYKKFVKQNIQLKNAISKLRAEQQGYNGILNRAAARANKYFNVLTMGLGAVTGFLFSAKEWVSGLVGMDDQLANVMKTTGLTRNEVRELHTEFKYLNTRTPRKELMLLAEEAGRLGKKSKQDVMEFVRVGNMIQTALGDDLGDNAAESIKEVGKLVNIYNVGSKHGVNFGRAMEMIGSSINEVSANSQAQAPYLIDMLKRMGGIAEAANIASHHVIGYGAALDNLGQAPEMSATALNKVIVNMFKDTETYAGIAGMKLEDFGELLRTDSNEAFLRFLDGLNGNNAGLSVMAEKLDGLGLNGARATQVLASLSANTKLIREQQEIANTALVKGTSLMDEYNVKNENMAGNLAIIGQRLRAVFVNSKLNAGMEKVVAYFAKWAKVDVSKQLEKERIEVNALAIKLTSTNISLEERNKAYDKLKEIHPGIVEGINAENVSVETLSTNLRKYNELMIRRIAIADSEQALQEERQRAATATTERIKAELELEKQMVIFKEKVAKSNERVAETMDLVILGDGTLIQKEAALRKLYEVNAENINLMANSQTRMYNATVRLNWAKEEEGEALDVVNRNIEEYILLQKKLLEVQDEIASTTSGSASSTDSGKIKEYDQDIKLMERYQQVFTGKLAKRREMSIKAVSEINDYEMEKFMETVEGRYMELEHMLNAMVIGKQEYADRRKEIDRDVLNAKLDNLSSYFNMAQSLSNSWSMFQETRMNRELAAAGDNEAKKAEIQKKYAEKQRNIAATQTLIQGALAIIKNTAQMGFVGAIPINIAQGIETAAQYALIKSQEFLTGGYTGAGAQNDVAGVVHKNEYVVPGWMMNDPGVLDVVSSLENMRMAGSTTIHNTYNQQSYTTNNQGGGSDDMLGVMNRLANALDRGIKAKLSYTEFEELEEEVGEIRDAVSR